MKRCLTLIGIILIFSSCDQVIFPEPQPKKVKPLTEIPAGLQGVYLDQDGDTLQIHTNSFSYYSAEFTSFRNIPLSDSSVLKEYHEHYFFSLPVHLEGSRYWLTYMLDVNDNTGGFDLYTMDPEDVVKLAKLQEITSKVRDIEGEDAEYYLFDPKRKHYKKIISDSIFTKMISFRKIQ